MNIKLIANKAFFKVKEASPTIAVWSGVALSVAALVAACKATPKAIELLDEAHKETTTIREIANDPTRGYSENDKQKALVMAWVKFVYELAKVYGPAIAMEIIAILLELWAHRSMKNRVVAVSAALAMASEGLRRGYERVNELYGEEQANDIFYGVHTEKVEEYVLDEETGKEKKVKVAAKVVDSEQIVDPYALIFDKNNPNYKPDDPNYMVDFISQVQAICQRKKNVQGYLFWNDIRPALGYKPVPAGQILGFEKDDVIDFGIDHISRKEVRDFRNGYDKVFMITFPGLHPIIEKVTELDTSNRAL